jgi:hypothetical protein
MTKLFVVKVCQMVNTSFAKVYLTNVLNHPHPTKEPKISWILEELSELAQAIEEGDNQKALAELGDVANVLAHYLKDSSASPGLHVKIWSREIGKYLSLLPSNATTEIDLDLEEAMELNMSKISLPFEERKVVEICSDYEYSGDSTIADESGNTCDKCTGDACSNPNTQDSYYSIGSNHG